MIPCRYCAQIRGVDASYPLREAAFDVQSDCPRCARHWRYLCQQCGEAHHFHATFFCHEEELFLCYRCGPERTETIEGFWAWEYYYTYRCPLCGGTHPGLDYAEFLGEHPYQQRPEWEAARRQLWPEPFLPRHGSHEREWLDAIRGKVEEPMSNFEYSGRLIETLMLGNVATLLGREIEYDPVAGVCVGDDEATAALDREHRKGWEL